MGHTIFKGINEKGLIQAEHIRVPVMITELIHDLPKMCQADIERSLRVIRRAAERDEWMYYLLKKSSRGDENDNTKTNNNRRNLCVDRWLAGRPGGRDDGEE